MHIERTNERMNGMKELNEINTGQTFMKEIEMTKEGYKFK